VTMISWLPRTELLAAMASADVFLFPSFRDGGGAVVVEAMAAGLPVVCLDSGGPGFHVQPRWGFKIEPGRPGEVVEAFARALRVLARDREFRRSLGRSGQQRAHDYYLWDRRGERLAAIYRRAWNGD